MASLSSLRYEDRLDEVSNFNPWKERITWILKMNGFWDLVSRDVQVPSNLNLATEHWTKDMKVRCIILDGVRDHIIPHILGKDIKRQMWVTLTGLYQSTNENRKTVLQKKLNIFKMNKSEIVTSYLTRVQWAHHELTTIGETVHDSKLIKVALKECVKQWTTIVDGFLARQQLPDWSRLWDDFTQKKV